MLHVIGMHILELSIAYVSSEYFLLGQFFSLSQSRVIELYILCARLHYSYAVCSVVILLCK